MDRLQRIFQGSQGGAGMGGAAGDSPQVDTSEQIYISSLALLKMLKHGAPHPLLFIVGMTCAPVRRELLCCFVAKYVGRLWQGELACRWR